MIWSSPRAVCRLDGVIQTSFTGAFPKVLDYLVPLLCVAQASQMFMPWWEGLTVQEQMIMQQRVLRSELDGDR